MCWQYSSFALRLKAVVVIAKRSRLLFQHRVLGFDRKAIIRRLSSHAELAWNAPTGHGATA